MNNGYKKWSLDVTVQGLFYFYLKATENRLRYETGGKNMTLEEAKKVKVGDKVIARFGSASLPVECEVTEILEGIERIRFSLAYQREDGKTGYTKRTHMRCWKSDKNNANNPDLREGLACTVSNRYNNYEFWEKEWLIDRIKQLENEVSLFRDDTKYDMVTELAKLQLELEKAENLICNQKTEIQVLRSYIAKKKELQK